MAVGVTISDMSVGGARLSVPPSAIIPAEFELLAVSERMLYPARRRWRKGNQMGIEFAGEPYRLHKPSIDNAPVHEEHPASAASGTAEPMPDVPAGAHISPEFAVRMANAPGGSGRTTCEIAVFLRNRGTIPASHPFLCIPALGLQVRPASGWNEQDILAVRKMKRFIASRDYLLEPGAANHCCTISLIFKAAFGGRFEYESGNEHHVASLPDLKLMCIAGAGNFPSLRLPFTIPARALRLAAERALTPRPAAGDISGGMHQTPTAAG